MAIKKDISQAVIKRLPRYYRSLKLLSSENIKKVSSKELAEMLDITASQVRQDFSNFGEFGQQGYGYDVDKLKLEFEKIIGIDKTYNMIIIGAGNLGKALNSYSGFVSSGFNIISLFDIEDKSNENILSIDSLTKNFIEENSIDIAIITVNSDSAQSIADKLVKCGVKNIWNFAAIDLDVPKDVNIENMFMSDSLFVLTYKMNH